MKASDDGVGSNLVIKRINEILYDNSNPTVDIRELRSLSRANGGFQSNTLRKQVWSKVLNINKYAQSRPLLEVKFTDDGETVSVPSEASSSSASYSTANQTKAKYHVDKNIKFDIERSLWSDDLSANWTDSQRNRRRDVLSNIIVTVLNRNKDLNLHYYQGFHDIVSVLLLITEDDYEAYLMTEKLCRYYIGDCMRTDFKDMVSIMNLLWLLIEHEDKELYSFLQESGVEPYFITSWIITWFSHDVKDLQVVARVFDALICSHPSYCLYLCASTILHYREEILKKDCDFASVHSFISKLTENFAIPFDDLILKADEICDRCPVTTLQAKIDQRLKRLVHTGRVLFFKDMDVIDLVPSDWAQLLHEEGLTIQKKANKEKSGVVFLRNPLVRKLYRKVFRSVVSFFDDFGYLSYEGRRSNLIWASLGIIGGFIGYAIVAEFNLNRNNQQMHLGLGSI